MLKQKELEILACFFPKLKEKTSKEIEVATGISHERVFSFLKALVKSNHLKERKIGHINVFEFVIREDTFLIYIYHMTKKSNMFKDKHLLLYNRLNEFNNSVLGTSLILFGSYAKGTEREDSDIDVLVVSNKNGVDKAASILKTKYAINIKPIVIKVNDFKNIKKDNLVFYNDLIEYGIVFDGIEFFYKEVYKNGKTIELVH